MPRALPLPAFAMLLALFACGAADRPSAEGDSASELQANPASGASILTPQPSDTAPGAEACTPREVRECRFYYTDERGERHCPMDIQICRVDGKDWLPCGLYRFDINGEPIKTR